MRLVQQRGELAKHRARLRHLGDLDGIFDDNYRTLLEDQQPARSRTGGEHVLAGLIGNERKGSDPLQEGGAIGNQGHATFLASIGTLPVFRGFMSKRNSISVAAPGGRILILEHDPEKWEPVFGKRSCSDKERSGMMIRRKII